MAAMALEAREHVVWRFDNVLIDTATHRVTVAGERCELEPKTYRLLRFLIENRHRALTKNEIFENVWEGAAVTDNALARAIAQLRKALGDDSRRPRYIETVPTVGYRFVAEVEAAPGFAAPTATAEAGDPKMKNGRKLWLVVAAALLVGLGIGIWSWSRRTSTEFVRVATPRVERLVSEGRYAEAHALATEVLKRDPAQPIVLPLMSEMTDVLSIRSTPPGAVVTLRRLDQPGEQQLGQTPIQDLSVVRGEYLVAVRKPGYADFERTLSSRLARAHPRNRTPWKLTVEARLYRTNEVPAGMIAIEANHHKLAAYSRPVNAAATLAPYFIDKHEVSNREFKEFVDAGGYLEPRFWKDSAVAAQLKDRTGIAAPRDWIGGAIADSKADHPVTGVTWHEASAYCRFRGKTLPTIFQWEEAARGSMETPFGVVFPWGMVEGVEIARRANLDGTGTVSTGEMAFGMSPYGAHQMAGNVSEWLLNRYDDGYMTAGGGWTDPAYSFGLYQSRPALYADASLGFRCAATPAAAGDQGNLHFRKRRTDIRYSASSAAAFQVSRERYRYPEAPLNAQLVSVKETAAWRREEIAFDGYAGKRAKAFLYLPRKAAGPFQTIHFLGGASWWMGVPPTYDVEDRAARLAPVLQSGRAVFLGILEGFAGREPVGGFARLPFNSPEYRDMLREWTIDMQRGVDYLMSRPDIDHRKIAFWNTSTVEQGIISAAVDGRYASLILIGGAVSPQMVQLQADANPLHFAPHIRAPKLVLTGQYDDWKAASSDPLFRLLVGPKKQVAFVGGHVPTNEIAVPLVNAFLDETLGKVQRR
jgi:eukaryotic-like serine/threonine-protein kinase